MTLPILITEKENTQPLLGLDWLNKLEIGLQGKCVTNIIRNITANKRGEKISEEFVNFFKKNHTRLNYKHSIEKRRQADTTKKEASTYQFSKKMEERTGKTD